MTNETPIKFANCKLEVERQIIVLLIEDLLGAGYSVGVNDGEETVLTPTRDEARIFAALFTTDEDFLLFRKDGTECGPKDADGWVRLIYGNRGYVISDYTTNLDEGVLARASELGERFGD
jgi:hypothetical protein